MYQHHEAPTPALWLFEHLFDEAEGWIVTFTGRQARLDDPDAPHNELTRTKQEYFRYPAEALEAVEYLAKQAERERDCYFAVHLFRERGSRRASNAVEAVSCLWLDEDEGSYPAAGPDPTAIVRSSRTRRHLYWRLSRSIPAGKAVELNRRIAAWSGGDTGKAGLASVLRAPGTANFKRHPKVDPVTVEIAGVPAWEPEVLEQAIPPLPEPETKRSAATAYDGPEVDLMEYLPNVEVLGEAPDEAGIKFAVVCPWAHEHSGGDLTGTFVGQREGGGLWFYCHHQHCQGRAWPMFRQTVRRRAKKLELIERGEYE